MHERVDLELRVVEGVRGRLLHLAVDDLPHPRVQAHLGDRERNRGGFEGSPMTKPQSQHPPLHRLSWEIVYQRGTVAKCGETTACSTPEYMRTGARVFWRELRRGLWVLPVSPCWAEGGGMGCSPPGAPTLGGCSELGCSISSARWCPREVLVPQHNPARGPTAGCVPGWFWEAGDAFPSTVHKQEANPLPCQTHPQIPTHLIPKLLQGCSWDRAISLKNIPLTPF